MKSSAFITESKEYKVNQVLDKLSDEDIVLALNSLTSNIKESALDKLKEIDDYLKTLSTEEKEALAILMKKEAKERDLDLNTNLNDFEPEPEPSKPKAKPKAKPKEKSSHTGKFIAMTLAALLVYANLPDSSNSSPNADSPLPKSVNAPQSISPNADSPLPKPVNALRSIAPPAIISFDYSDGATYSVLDIKKAGPPGTTVYLGKRISAAKYGKEESYAIYAYNTDGEGVQVLTPGGYDDTSYDDTKRAFEQPNFGKTYELVPGSTQYFRYVKLVNAGIQSNELQEIAKLAGLN